MEEFSTTTTEVKMGEFLVSGAPSFLNTSGIGSCIAICLYSHASRVGALAHVMLPGTGPSTDYRYTHSAVAAMVSQLEAAQVRRGQLVAKIVGGANMFPDIQGRSQKVGERNIESVHEALKQWEIPITAEETGGSAGRAVIFDLNNGIVTIKMTI